MNKIEYSTLNWLAHKINNNSIVKNINLLNGVVVDLGCGISPYKTDILNHAEKYMSVDWHNSQHDQSNVDIFADLSKTLPIENNIADAVVSFQVMEHLPEPDFFLSECFRILKNEGCLFITVPFMWHVHEEPHDYFRYTRYGLEYLLKKNGFVDINIEENTGFWQMWILKFNYHTNRFAVGVLKYFWIPIWWLGQTISPLLDKIDNHPEETASYTVIARKP